jgi:hypothetical protein
MAQYLLRNSLNPYKVVQCGLSFRQVTPKDGDAEPIWVIEIGTAEPDINGDEIAPIFMTVTSADNLSDVIAEGTERVAAQIDWSPLLDDTRKPHITLTSPEQSEDEASIWSNIEIHMTDLHPSAGIDESSIEMTVNGFDVTSEIGITGDGYDKVITWSPPYRVLDTY